MHEEGVNLLRMGEFHLVLEAMWATRGNQIKAAQRLGITQKQICWFLERNALRPIDGIDWDVWPPRRERRPVVGGKEVDTSPKPKAVVVLKATNKKLWRLKP